MNKITLVTLIIMLSNIIMYHYGGYERRYTQSYWTRDMLMSLYKLVIYLAPALLLLSSKYIQSWKPKASFKRVGISITLGLIIIGTKYIANNYLGFESYAYGATVLYIVITNNIIEEYVFRGLILSNLKELYSTNKAIIIQAILFGLIHIPLYLILWGSGLAMIGSVIQITVFGWYLGYCKEQTQSLFYPIVLHSIRNSVLILL